MQESKREKQKTMAAKQMSLTLLVDEKRKRVIYAESGKDFVETLLSFLTLPLGTVIKLSGKQSKMGSFTMLYQSLEDFDLEFLSTESCKEMLLNPKSSAVELYENLHPMFDLGATKPTQYYVCSSWKHGFEGHTGSTVENARCHCGKTMNCRIYEEKGVVDAVGGDGVFLKGNMRFMIRDDLQVSVVSSCTCFALLRELGISDASVLVERKVIVGEEEVLHLLKCLLLSKTPLTDVFLGELNTIDVVDLDLNVTCHDSKDNQSQSEKEMGDGSKNMNVKLIMSKSNHRVLYADGGEEFIDLLFCFLSFHLGSVAKCFGGCTGMGFFDNLVGDSKKMNVKLFLSKSNNRVLYAEGGEEFTDLLFSFLAFPLGSIVKCLGGCTDTGCLDNLYKSTEDLSRKDCMISGGCKAMLLNPKLPPYFGTKNQLLQIEEQVPRKPKFVWCATCRGSAAFITSPRMCCHSSRREVQLSTTNPKFPGAVTELGGAFVAGQAMFMVTDELAVKPLSTVSGISLLSKFNIPISDIEEQIVCIGEKEAMSLLKASLVSNSVLSDVFCPKKDGNKI
ncbi:hypothetical protein CKAN_01264500 [Cinnamomum micranthum f. kanehirae]|uniref:DUF674 domain-containing protein n=1 Tax=Cinnamomum micranthum f. kanehirae TaxID=337451 RepID=A0A3S3QE01_9MAGN|nr:hypothetical protein CKAN_01264500 [Cinnamomum micranthum f. kanehirae]